MLRTLGVGKDMRSLASADYLEVLDRLFNVESDVASGSLLDLPKDDTCMVLLLSLVRLAELPQLNIDWGAWAVACYKDLSGFDLRW